MTTDDKILRYIAERSPKAWAKIIRRRFEWALGVLNAARLNLMNQGDWRFRDAIGLGCPHCDRYCCGKSCLYMEAAEYCGLLPNISYRCITIAFGGLTLHKISNQTYVNIILSDNNIEVAGSTYLGCNLGQAYGELLNCRKFCQAHIDWTHKYKWGKKLKKESRQ